MFFVCEVIWIFSFLCKNVILFDTEYNLSHAILASGYRHWWDISYLQGYLDFNWDNIDLWLFLLWSVEFF